MKKIFLCAALSAFLATTAVGAHVFAQTASAGASLGSSISSGAMPPISASGSGFVQFNNLTVQAVSGASAPATITASAQFYPQLPPGVGATVPLNGSTGVSVGTSGAAGSAASACLKYNSENASTGLVIPCPMTPPVNPGGPLIPVSSSSASAATGASMPNIAVAAPYQIDISTNTELMFRDRTPATLADFAQGDTINVFGYYNADGSIQAYLVRDISKPVETQTMQLDNVTLASLSASNVPATLEVTQAQGAPCLGFSGNTSAQIACPMGVMAFPGNPGTTSATAPTPSGATPNFVLLRKYVVNVDSQTIILDRNRTQLSLASLNPGDTLNVYGETSDNGQTIDADIVRDLSIPPAPSSVNGTVTQVNADGSFVIQTDNGQTLTVQNPVSVGETVTLQGMINSAQNLITEISRLMIASSTAPMPVPPQNGLEIPAKR